MNDVGDVYAQRRDSGAVEEVDPSTQWHWLAHNHALGPDGRRTIDQLRGLPGYSISETSGARFTPGPRRRGAVWMRWLPGHAPPAAVESKNGGDGTRAYFDRLSDAYGHVTANLPGQPDRSPMVVHDFIRGFRTEIAYDAPSIGPGGEGVVYVVDDGDAYKIGHTVGPPDARIAGLQTGNPRVIRAIATVAGASPAVEAHLHASLAEWNRRGEWFDRDAVRRLVEEAGGWRAFLLETLPLGDWEIRLYD